MSKQAWINLYILKQLAVARNNKCKTFEFRLNILLIKLTIPLPPNGDSHKRNRHIVYKWTHFQLKCKFTHLLTLLWILAHNGGRTGICTELRQLLPSRRQEAKWWPSSLHADVDLLYSIQSNFCIVYGNPEVFIYIPLPLARTWNDPKCASIAADGYALGRFFSDKAATTKIWHTPQITIRLVAHR